MCIIECIFSFQGHVGSAVLHMFLLLISSFAVALDHLIG